MRPSKGGDRAQCGVVAEMQHTSAWLTRQAPERILRRATSMKDIKPTRRPFNAGYSEPHYGVLSGHRYSGRAKYHLYSQAPGEIDDDRVCRFMTVVSKGQTRCRGARFRIGLCRARRLPSVTVPRYDFRVDDHNRDQRIWRIRLAGACHFKALSQLPGLESRNCLRP